MNVLDLFAGAGGWSVACRELGLDESGVEIDKSARLTRLAAGFVNHDCNDVRDLDPLLFSQNALGGVIASPPCQDWSKAGKQRGRLGPTGSLVDTTFEIVRCLLPRWVAFEQVPRVLPEWEAFAEELRRMSYSTWTGVLSAEEYGVPQIRKRAILIASRSSAVGRPPPTHSWFNPRNLADVNALLPRARTVNEALGWEHPLWNRPATTVVSEFRPHLLTKPGHNKRDAGDFVTRQHEGTPMTVQEAGILQGFSRDFPWQGSETSKRRQIGNAICPRLALAILKEATR